MTESFQMPPQTRFMDEIDAAEAGTAFLDSFTEQFPRTYSLDSGSGPAPRVKWVAMFDSYDVLRAGYILTRDLKNWTQLTVMGLNVPEPPKGDPVQRTALEGLRDASHALWAAGYFDDAKKADAIIAACIALSSAHVERIRLLEEALAGLADFCEQAGFDCQRARALLDKTQTSLPLCPPAEQLEK